MTDISTRLLELLAKRKSGVSSLDARSMLNASQNGVCRAARALIAEGRVVSLRSGHTRVICLAAHQAEARRELREGIDARANRRKVRQAEWRKRRHERDQCWYPGVQSVDADRSVQRVVSASKVAPLRKLGPASVWELAC